MKTMYAVMVMDSTCNVLGHETGIYGKGDYSWVSGSLNGGENAEYNMTREEAEAVKAEFEDYIKENNLEWASVCIDEFEIEEEEYEVSEKEAELVAGAVLACVDEKKDVKVLSAIANEDIIMYTVAFGNMEIRALKYHDNDIIFLPLDWQGWMPECLSDIRDCEWVANGQSAFILNDYPRIF